MNAEPGCPGWSRLRITLPSTSFMYQISTTVQVPRSELFV
jgi:hypothetical protein